MIGFEYKYKTSEEIIKNIKIIGDFNGFEYILFLATVIIFIICIYYVLPLLYIVKKYWDRQQEKRKRKLILKQITLQKDIEDEIESEIEELEKQKAAIK